MRKFLVFAIALILLTGAVAAWAADSPRSFAPVQGGPAQSTSEAAPWAPDRVLVQFTEQAYEMTSLPDPADKSAGPVNRTGIASVDQAMGELDVRGLRAAFPGVANRSAARAMGTDRWYIVDLGAGADVQAAVKRLEDDPNLAAALPDLIAYPHVIPDDPFHGDNWGHNNTAQLPEFDWGGTWAHTGAPVGTEGFDSNAQAAWNGTQGYGDSGVVIAIIDSGVDVGHPDLVQVTGWDFGDNDSNPDDDSAAPGHGTACAGIAAAIADNGTGVDGIAGGCSIMPLKAAASDGSIYLSAVSSAIYYAADNGADVISMSLGAATTSYPATDTAITYAYNNGVTILASTGNENTDQIGYPAYHSLVIGVGAASPCGERKRSGTSSEVNPGVDPDPNGSTCDEERWWGSNYGSSVQDHQGAVDVLAPTILPTTDIQGTGGYDSSDYSEFFNGTSCSSPYAAGVAALIKSANPGFTPHEVRTQLVATAEDVVSVESVAGWDRYAGYGMVDAAAAVGAVIPPAVVADFEADDTSGCISFTVNFTDLSTGTVDSWMWDFGDGLASLSQNPSHTYSEAGVYDVSLSASGPEGNDSVTKFGYIVVGEVPDASFETSIALPAAIPIGDSVDFTDTSTGTPTSWLWDFGDGEMSTEQNPTHVFNTAGFANVSLTVSSDCGSNNVALLNELYVIPPAAPTADFSLAPAIGCAPLEVDFTDESTGTPTSWEWDFGDGATSTEQHPTHTYTDPGTYDVSLTAANDGGSDSKTVTGAVTVEGPPAASFSASIVSIAQGESVTFTDASTGTPTSWEWDFGDGGTSTEQHPVHRFDTAGVFTVTLIAANDCGTDELVMTDYITVEALADAPVAAFSHTPSDGCAPLEVTFTDESLNDVSEWYWDFGDGAQDTEQNPVHVYVDPGSFDVRLIVSGTGGVDTLTVADAVVVSAPVAAAFAVSDTVGLAPLEVTFTDVSTGSPTSWLWNFGDAATDTVQNPVHTYTAKGLYDVTLIVANACSADTLTMTALVDIVGVSGVGDLAKVPFGLAGNYPNPFNPSTTIVFNLEKSGHARLEIFDISGRRVATLLDGAKSSGRHEILWRPADLASGIYFSRLVSGDETDTQRLMLIK